MATYAQIPETILLRLIAADEVDDRPDRVEPLALKRRPKQYPLLMNLPAGQSGFDQSRLG